MLILSAFPPFPASFDDLYFKMESLTLLHILFVHVIVLSSSSINPVPWDLHLNFCCRMIKRNLERYN